MKFFKTYLLLSYLLALSCISCRESDSAAVPFLKLTTESGEECYDVCIPKAECTLYVWLQSNVEWSINTQNNVASWLSIVPRKGNGSATLEIHVDENTTALPRTGKIVVSVRGMRDVVYELLQSANDEFVIVEADKNEMPHTGGKVAFKVKSNCDWNYSITNPNNDMGEYGYEETLRNDSMLQISFAPNVTQEDILYKVIFSGISARTYCNVNVKSKYHGLPVPDLLDVEFLVDGTAKGVSKYGNNVITVGGPTLSTYFDTELFRYVAKFDNPMYNYTGSGYYSIDYLADSEFIKDIEDGCTFETIFKINEEHNENKEIKWFGSMASGGIGFLISDADKGKSISFRPNINSADVWIQSGVVPRVGQFYHVVGVYDKENETSAIYINGDLMEEVKTIGNLSHVSHGAERFIVGGDAMVGDGCTSAINGEVAMARIYSEPLSVSQVSDLWKATEFKVENYLEINRVLFLPEATISPGCKFSVYGKGFIDGDLIRMSVTGTGGTMATTVDNEKATVIIPEGFKSGKYFITVVRGNKSLILGTTNITIDENPRIVTPEIIAHRGVHTTGETENSIGSLRESLKMNTYGCELDVHITADDRVVVHNDGVADGKAFYNCTYEEIKNITLANGEKLPTFEDVIKLFQEYKDKTRTKLIINVAPGPAAMNTIDVVMSLIDAANLGNRVEYVSLGYDICQYIISKNPMALVGYLGGGFSPTSVSKDGIKSICYSVDVYDNHKEWIKEAQALKMKVNVWDVNDQDTMLKFIGRGVDYITTDRCELLADLLSKKFITK